MTAAGQAAADHPLLGAAVELAAEQGESLVLTGRLSLSTHPWLADHQVAGAVLLPGTAFLELALHAAHQAGAEIVQELTVDTPLILSAAESMAIQVSVSGPSEDGHRQIAIHSRPERLREEELDANPSWTRHAEGTLSQESIDLPQAPPAWPPAGAEPIETDYLYDILAEHGLDYGPTFQGLDAAWNVGKQVYAQISLPDEQVHEAERFCIHPALLDSAAHAGLDLEETQEGKLMLPHAWRGVGIIATAAASLRVQLDLDGGGIAAFDETGEPVVCIASLERRAVELEELEVAQPQRALYRVEWQSIPPGSANGAEPTIALLGDVDAGDIGAERYADLPTLLAAIDAGADVPGVVISAIPPAVRSGELPAVARASAEHALGLLQEWASEERLATSRLTLLTDAAIAVGPGDTSPDLAVAPVWGLVRSAISELPGRVAIVDLDSSEGSRRALSVALSIGADEPQLALRDGAPSAPRLVRFEPESESGSTNSFDPERTVLITGGLNGLGALVAHHLVERHGVRHLLLVSRRGPEVKGADELKTELEELGAAEVTIAACDVADRGALERLLASIPDEHPLGAIVHSAGVLDDGVLESMDGQRLARTMRPKADAAWHLHELSAGLDLSHFLMFSSAAGLIGGAAQANYAAANVSLDAIAAVRHSQGLPATALAWGFWDLPSGLVGAEAGELIAADRAAMERVSNQIRRRLGFDPIAAGEGLELFDAACGLSDSLLAPVRFDAAALRAHAQAGTLASILRGLVRVSVRREAKQGSLTTKLASVPAGERETVVLDLVRAHVAAVLGHASAAEVESGRAFQELGFDSLAAVELRNRLTAATGLEVSPTAVFDYPNPTALAAHLLSEVGGVGGEDELREEEVRTLLARLEAALATLDSDDGARERAGNRLRSLLIGLAKSEALTDGQTSEDLAAMSHEEMFELIDEEFGDG
jgi:pimaricinolide synthase PimS1